MIQMRDFIEMIVNMEEKRQEAVLGKLQQLRTKCGIFCPSKDEYCIGVTNNLLSMLQKNNILVKAVYTLDAAALAKHFAAPVYSINALDIVDNRPQCMLMFHQNVGWHAVEKIFRSQGMETFMLYEPQKIDAVHDAIIAHLVELYDAYACLSDDESRKSFCGAVLAKTTGQIRYYQCAAEPQYLLEGFMPTQGDIAIDGGAFDGGTAADFVSLGATVYSFEMDGKNFQTVKESAHKNHFTAENRGLWSRQASKNYMEAGAGSFANDNGPQQAEFIDLDTYIEERGLPRIDYIKMDIEGAEIAALQGASKAIAKWKPKMAISIYHKLEDLWTLPNYIKSIRTDYEMKFRHYPCDMYGLSKMGHVSKEVVGLFEKFEIGSKIPTVWESVLYCR